jgi:hypothetical protein
MPTRGREKKMNRPSQRRADPHHPHTFKADQRRARRHARFMDRWHARWEAEQYGGGLDESASAAVLERLAQAAFEIMPHRHPSGRTPDWSMQPESVRRVFVSRAYASRFDGPGIPERVAGHLSLVHVLSRVRTDSTGYDAVPTEAAILAAIPLVTGDLAAADLEITVSDDGGLSVLDVGTFVFRRIDADGVLHRT